MNNGFAPKVMSGTVLGPRVTTPFSHDLRILTCQSCGAPIDAALLGGLVTCSYCNATHTVSQRDERTDRERARLGLGSAISESERHAQLRLQDGRGHELPESLRAWQLPDGSLNPAFAEQAANEWQAARQQIAAGSKAFNVAERLFALTLLLAEQLSGRRLRSMLETAAELLEDERHRHIVRCLLARLAAQHGDVTGAQAWLETCNPRPTDLVMDTAYRHAAATLAVVQQSWQRVHELLGTRSGDVPLADREELSCELLRVHAIEQQADLTPACQELDRLAVSHGEAALQRRLAAHAPLVLCARSHSERQRRSAAIRDEALLLAAIENRRNVQRGWRALSAPLGALPIWAVLLLIPIAPIRCTTDSDPLLGVYGLPLCPYVCEGCFGPTRTVTRWSGTGKGVSSDGAEYFCNTAESRVDRLSDDQLEGATRQLEKQQLGFMAALGGSYLTLLGLLTLVLPIDAYRRHRAAIVQEASLDREIAALSQRLGRSVPQLSAQAAPAELARELRFVSISIAIALLFIVIGVYA